MLLHALVWVKCRIFNCIRPNCSFKCVFRVTIFTTRKLRDTDGQIRHNLVGKVAYRWNTDEKCPSVSSRRYTDIRRKFVGKYRRTYFVGKYRRTYSVGFYLKFPTMHIRRYLQRIPTKRIRRNFRKYRQRVFIGIFRKYRRKKSVGN